MTKDRLFLTLAMSPILVGIFLTLLITFWLSYPYKPIEVSKITVDQKEIKVGENLTYSVEYCKYTDKPAVITKVFYDGVVFPMSSIYGNHPIGCRRNEMTITLPHLPEGEYVLEIIFAYQVNPLKNVEVRARTNSFKVVE